MVLVQGGNPLAFTSKKFYNHNLRKSIYEKGMMAILHVVEDWNSYLIGRCFHIKTNHHSLNYFLEEILFPLEKHKWVYKMLGYDYDIIYKKDK
jgi:hypothetical protein